MAKKSVKSIAKRLADAKAQMRTEESMPIAANDVLADIETRWGPGFAQWVLDGLQRDDRH